MKDAMLISHLIGLVMGLGTSFGFMFIGIAASKMEKVEGMHFLLKVSILSRMGQIGLGLLLVSGIYLILPYTESLSEFPMLIVKLGLFLVLGALVGITSSKMKKAQKGDTEKHLKTVKKLGKLSLLVGVTILVLAVLTFH